MPLDPYASCPGGTGKKVKFCCPDLLADLEKLDRMLGAQQRAGALDQIEILLEKYPDRACLLSYKTLLEGLLKGSEAAQATAGRYLELYPDNPVALAELTLAEATGGDGLAAVATLQRAMVAIGNQEIPHQLYSAIGAVGENLLRAGNILAGRGHFLLQLGLGEGRDEAVLSMIAKLQASPAIPLLMKQEVGLVDAPADAIWKKDFDAAMDFAYRGCWRKAVEMLSELGGKNGAQPAILRNLAMLLGWLGDETGACAALRDFAASPAVPRDDAVEAEALAQLIDPRCVDLTATLRLLFPVVNFEQLQARLFAHPQTPRMPYDLSQLATEGQPSPKGAYFILDRPIPASGAGLSHRDAPRIVGQALLYSRETDRDARLEVIVDAGHEAAATAKTLAAAAGDSLGREPQEESLEDVPTIQRLFSWNWRLPDDTTVAQRLAMMAAERRDTLLERWSNLPLGALGGKTPRDAAGDPGKLIPLLAAILNLELAVDNEVGAFDFNELRASLDLPPNGAIDPRQFPRTEVPLARLGRVALDPLDDEEVLENFDRAQHLRHVTALRRFAQEIVRRPSSSGERKAAAHGVLAQTEIDTRQALLHVDEARRAAESAGRSSAPWDLTELSLRLNQVDMEGVNRILHHIRAEHMNEPGVAEALFRLLVDAGVLGPDGLPTARPAAAAAAPSLLTPGGESAAGAAAPANKLWTPGAAEPAAAARKSAIWTPGS